MFRNKNDINQLKAGSRQYGTGASQPGDDGASAQRSGAQHFNVYKVVFIAMMAAIVCVVTFFRFPLFGSKVHLANAMCLLSGLLFGPIPGGLAAGIGSALYDSLFGGYDIVQCLITFVSKFLMAAICAGISGATGETVNKARIAVGCCIGALSYVALYMLKTYIYQRFVYAYPLDTVGVALVSKLPASLINAVVAMVCAPALYAALRQPLVKTGVMAKLQS